MKRIAVLAAVFLSGCALAMVTPVSSAWTPESNRSPVCDEDPSGPVKIDIIGAIIGTFATFAAPAAIACSPKPERPCGADNLANVGAGGAALLIGAATIGLAYSAIEGRRMGVACRAAKETFAAHAFR